MAIKHSRKDGKPGYQWGETGDIFTYNPDDPQSKLQARQNALKQGQSIEINKGSAIAEDVYASQNNTPGSQGSSDTGQSGQPGSSETFDIKKYYDDEQLVFGWASVAKDKDGNRPIEWQGDEIEMFEMEPAVYDFVLTQGITKEMHRVEKAKGQVVESVIFTKEKMAAMGIPEGTVPEGWWVGFKLADKDTFMKVKAGIYKMFSIEGKGIRTPIGGAS